MTNLTEWGFNPTETEPRDLVLRKEGEFILIIIVVDDMMFVTNSTGILNYLKERVSQVFDVKFFGAISSFIDWESRRGPNGIECSQIRYTKELIRRYGL